MGRILPDGPIRKRLKKRSSKSSTNSDFWSCVERYKNYLISFHMGEYALSKDEAIERLEEANWLYDYEIIKENMESDKYSFKEAGEYPKVVQAMNIVKQSFPEIYDYLEDSVYVFWGEEERLETMGVMMPSSDPFDTDKCDYAIYLEEGAVNNGRPEDIAGILTHEGMHIDARINPRKYGISEDEWGQYFEELFGTVERKINEKIEEIHLPREKIEGWTRGIHFRTLDPVYLRIHACMEGKSCPVGYVQRSEIDE